MLYMNVCIFIHCLFLFLLIYTFIYIFIDLYLFICLRVLSFVKDIRHPEMNSKHIHANSNFGLSLEFL